MILYYVLVLSLPLVSHSVFGSEAGGVTVVKYLGLVCLAYALLSLPRRRRPPDFLATPRSSACAGCCWSRLRRWPSPPSTCCATGRPAVRSTARATARVTSPATPTSMLLRPSCAFPSLSVGCWSAGRPGSGCTASGACCWA